MVACRSHIILSWHAVGLDVGIVESAAMSHMTPFSLFHAFGAAYFCIYSVSFCLTSLLWLERCLATLAQTSVCTCNNPFFLSYSLQFRLFCCHSTALIYLLILRSSAVLLLLNVCLLFSSSAVLFLQAALRCFSSRASGFVSTQLLCGPC